jgi:quinol monooxygenase YgiN
MDRRTLLSAQTVVAGACLAGVFGASTSARAATGTFVAIALTAPTGKSREDVIKAMQPFVDLIRKTPGLIDQILLESSFPNNTPSHVHLMHWQEMKDWEALFQNPQFMAAIEASGNDVKVNPAEVFTQVKM